MVKLHYKAMKAMEHS